MWVAIIHKIHCQFFNSITTNHVTKSDHEESLIIIKLAKKSLILLTNECSSNMKFGWFFNFFMNKMKMKQQICMLQLHLFISDMRSNFAELDNSFWTLEEYFLNFVCSSQSNGVRYNSFMFNLLYHHFPITFLSLEQEWANSPWFVN